MSNGFEHANPLFLNMYCYETMGGLHPKSSLAALKAIRLDRNREPTIEDNNANSLPS